MTEARLLAVVGATGTGKTAFAIELAERVGGEVVSCDSGQVYRRLDVGTAKPTAEELARIPHHLVDVLEPDAQWSAAEFAAAADAAIAQIRGRGRVPILVGGNGLWYRALVRGLFEAPPIDPALRARVRTRLRVEGPEALHDELARVDPTAAARIERRDPQRIGRALEVYLQTGTPISVLQAAHGFRTARHRVSALAFDWDRGALRARLEGRVEQMFARGLVDEARACLADGLRPDAPGLRTIGYKEAVAHLEGRLGLDEAIRATVVATHQYAKRQRNWFRHEAEVAWVSPSAGVEEAMARLHAVFDGV